MLISTIPFQPSLWYSTSRRILAPFLPIIIVMIALGLRLYGLDWDQGHLYHPDERAILMKVSDLRFPPINNLSTLLDAQESPLNPHWFPYGSLPLYLLETVQTVAGNWTNLDLFELRLPGRALAALADTGTVVVLLYLGATLYGRKVGLLAAALLAVAVLHVQISHFFTVDPFMTFFAMLSLLFTARLMRKASISNSAFAGIFLGLALACKASAIALLFPLWVGHLLPLLANNDQRIPFGAPSLNTLRKAIPGLILDIAVSLAVFPLVWLFVNHAHDISAGLHALPSPTTAASIVTIAIFLALGTTHILHATTARESGLIGNIITPSLLGMLVAVGAGAMAFFLTMPYAFLDWPNFFRDVGEQWQMSHRVLDYPYTRQYENTTPYLYYIRQLGLWGLGIPLALTAGAGLAFSLWVGLRWGHRSDLLLLSFVVPIFILIGGQEVKFLRYLLPIIPLLVLMGARMLFWLKIKAISWHYYGPILVSGVITVVLGSSTLYAVAYDRIYTQPHPATEASSWISNNIPKGAVLLKEHWEEGLPNLSNYRTKELPLYDADTIEKMHEIASSLSEADYLLLYSHRLYGTITRLPDRYPLTNQYYQSLFSGELGYTLQKQFTSYPNLLGLALRDDNFLRSGLPPPENYGADNSYLVSLDLGFADESFTVYDHPQVLIFANTSRYTQDQFTSLLLAPKGQTDLSLMLTPTELQIQQGGGTYSEIFNPESISNKVPVLIWLLLIETVSLVAVPLGFIVFRGLSDKGFLLSKIMGVLLFAYIPWLLAATKLLDFSAASIYLSLILLAIPGLAVFIVMRRQILSFISERWRILVFEELLFLIAFLAFLALRWANPDLWHPFRGGEKPMDFAYLNAIIHSSTMPPYDPWFAGGFLNYYYFGQFIIATIIKATGILPEIAYNLAIPLLFALTVAGAFSIVYNLTDSIRNRRWERRGASWGPPAAGIAAALLVVVLGNIDGMVQLVQGTSTVLFTQEPFPAFDFWRSTRMMPPDPPGFEITEFPYFSFLFADLHAHLIAIPFTLLVAGTALSLVLSALRTNTHWLALTPLLAIMGLAVGALGTINSWDYPGYLMLGMGSIGLAYYSSRKRLDMNLLVVTVLGGTILAVLSYAAFLPFHDRYVAFELGGHLSKTQTSIHQYLAIHGLFLFILVSYLLYESQTYLTRFWSIPASRKAGLLIAGVLLISGTIAWDISTDTSYETSIILLLIIGAILLLGCHRLRNPDEETPHHLYLMMLMSGALAIGIATDIVTLNGDIDRMNTVFKLYIESWVLFGLSGGIVLWLLFTGLGKPWQGYSIGKTLWFISLTLLIISTAVYPVLGTRARLADRFSTHFQGLDGTAFMENMVYTNDPRGPIDLHSDKRAIKWLRSNVQGSPVIAEGISPLYRWGSRVSIYTGLPTIIGWDWHQTQQRFEYQNLIRKRTAQVHQLFTTSNHEEALGILKEHNVSYIYVGQLEDHYYPKAGLDKFKQMSQSALELVYDSSGVKIYRVRGQPT